MIEMLYSAGAGTGFSQGAHLTRVCPGSPAGCKQSPGCPSSGRSRSASPGWGTGGTRPGGGRGAAKRCSLACRSLNVLFQKLGLTQYLVRDRFVLEAWFVEDGLDLLFVEVGDSDRLYQPLVHQLFHRLQNDDTHLSDWTKPICEAGFCLSAQIYLPGVHKVAVVRNNLLVLISGVQGIPWLQ